MLHAAVAPSLPASGVTHSIVGYFSNGLSNSMKELIIFKKNNLELWRVPANVGKEYNNNNNNSLFITSMQLNAPPVSVAACRPPGFTVDIIAMCFDDFHASFIKYDPMLMRFNTIALVQLDDREVSNDLTPLEPLMRADPTGRFIAILARRRHMFLLPLLGQKRNDNDDEENNNNNNNNNNTGNIGKEDNKLKEDVTVEDDWGDEDDYNEKESKPAAAEEEKDDDNNNNNETKLFNKNLHNETSPENNDFKIINTSEGLLRIGQISMFTLATAVKGSIRYIRDIQFIESSGEPIIAILCERQPTWAGRVKLVEWRTKSVESKMLSMHMIWVQISSASTNNPKMLLIGEVDDIPYNVTHMMPVSSFAQTPSGVVCFGINTVMHITTKRGFGVYLNDNGKEECANSKSSAVSYEKVGWSDPQLENSTALFKVNLSLANCTATSIIKNINNNHNNENLQILIVSEEDGVVLTLLFTSQGSIVQDIKINILGTGCYCSSISPIEKDVIFLGSASGDSYIAIINPNQNESNKKFKIIENMESIGFIADMDLIDSSYNNGNKKNEQFQPSSQTAWLDNMPYAELLQSTTLEPMPPISIIESRANMDLVLCAGNGGSGSLFILRQSIRNILAYRKEVNAVSAFFLESVQQNSKRLRVEGMEKELGELGEEKSSNMIIHTTPHLILTGLSFTILFTVRGDSVQQVRLSEFLTSCRTVFASDLPWLNALLQITEREGRIISSDGKNLLHKFFFVSERDIEKNKSVKSAYIMSELQLLFILLEDGILLQFNLKNTQVASTKEIFAEGITAFTLWNEKKRILLFNTNGTMIINEIESKSTYALFQNLNLLPPYSLFGISESLKEIRDNDIIPIVSHLEIVTLSDDKLGELISLIIILSTGELAIYQVLPKDEFGPLRLIKSTYHFLDNKAEREVFETIEAKKQRLERERKIIQNDTQLMRNCSRRIIPFNNIGGNNGVYVCGQHPLFFFWDKRLRQLVPYRHQTPSPVRGFIPFPSIDGGYIYCCEGFVDFASINTYCQPKGNGWLSRRVHLDATPHFIVYHPPAKSCFVITSKKEPFRPQRAPFDVQLKINYDEESGNIQSIIPETPVCNLPPISSNSGIRVPMVNRFEIKLMSTKDWNCTDKLLLEENEQVLGAQMIEIHSDNNIERPGTAPVCVVNTAFPLGEDITCRGRIIILATMWVKGEWKILRLHSEPLNGPATAITGIRNHIAVAIGGTIKIFRFNWESRKLVVSALLYAGIYITKMSVFRNFLIYGDLSRSCALARFNEENHTLTVLGKDRNTLSVVHCDMMYHDRAFGILCADDQRNILILGYTPRVQETEAGRPPKVLESILSPDGEYRLPGGCLVKSLRLRSLAGHASVSVYGSNYGEIGFIIPVGEQAHRTALWLSRRLQTDIHHPAGLTPRMFLGLQQGNPKTSLRAKEMLISGPLLQQFFQLDIKARRGIASAAYTQLDRVTNVAALIYEECSLF